MDETITQCSHFIAQRIDESIGDDISILDRLEFYGAYVKVHTTKRHAVREGDTVLLSGIVESDWSNLNGISFIVKETTSNYGCIGKQYGSGKYGPRECSINIRRGVDQSIHCDVDD